MSDVPTNVLVVAAHADDEALGCGGTMAMHSARGDRVYVVFVADGVGARGDHPEALEVRERAATAACAALGAEPPVFLGLPDNRLDSLPLLDIVQRVEAEVDRIKPSIVYTHHGGDLNVDHRITHQAVLTACRPQPGEPVQAIYSFEVPSSTEWSSAHSESTFRPQRFVDITGWMDQKKEALGHYADEMRPFPHARSMEGIEALARWRGVTVGLQAAEAFMVERQIVRD